MRVKWLGWAGVELEASGETLVIDLLRDASPMWSAALGERASEVPPPSVVPAAPGASGGLVTHLHRDHADAAALGDALAPGARLLGPPPGRGEGLEELGLRQATAELARAGLELEPVAPWESREIGPFTVTALPAVDGSGDPQVSWLVAADGERVLHCGDTLFHGYWWRSKLRHGPIDVALLPINGAAINFPHRQPHSTLPAVMDPEQAALAGELLEARAVIPIHYGGFEIEPYYVPVEDPEGRFVEASAGYAYEAVVLDVGEAADVRELSALRLH